MLVIFWANHIEHTVCRERILLAQEFLGPHVRGVGADDFTGEALAILFVRAALHRFHLQQGTALINPRLLSKQRRAASNVTNRKKKTRMLIILLM